MGWHLHLWWAWAYRRRPEIPVTAGLPGARIAFFSGESSKVFAGRLPFDEATWARGRGWAIWKAMKVLVGALKDDPEDAAYTTGVIGAILADHVAAGG